MIKVSIINIFIIFISFKLNLRFSVKFYILDVFLDLHLIIFFFNHLFLDKPFLLVLSSFKSFFSLNTFFTLPKWVVSILDESLWSLFEENLNLRLKFLVLVQYHFLCLLSFSCCLYLLNGLILWGP